MTEKKLVEQCLKGNALAQQRLYEQYAPKMLGVCLRYAGDSDLAKDLLQDAFIVVFNKLDSFNHEGSFEGWIRRIVVNTALMHIRKSTSFVEYDDLSMAVSISDNTDAIQDLSADDLMKMINSLPKGYRTVFNLFAIEGYSHQEIAELLSITEGSSRSQYHRARKQLQELVTREYGESYRKRQLC